LHWTMNGSACLATTISYARKLFMKWTTGEPSLPPGSTPGSGQRDPEHPAAVPG